MSRPQQACFKLNTKIFMKWHTSHENHDSLKEQPLATLMWGTGWGGLKHDRGCFGFYSSYSSWENEEFGEIQQFFLKNNCIWTAHKEHACICSTDNTFSDLCVCVCVGLFQYRSLTPLFTRKEKEIFYMCLIICKILFRFIQKMWWCIPGCGWLKG